MIKKLTKIAIAALLFGVFGFLLLPLPGAFTRNQRFESETPIALVASDLNLGVRCRADVIYSTEAAKQFREGEGYEFTVDNHCANLQKDLTDAVSSGDIENIRRLITEGANPRGKDYSGFEAINPVQIAAHKSVPVAKLLLDNGADPNEEYCCCASCRSPLVSAIWTNDSELVDLFLQRGANIYYKPDFSDEPYDIADVAIFDCHNREIIDLLENACGANAFCRAEFRVKRLAYWIGYRNH